MAEEHADAWEKHYSEEGHPYFFNTVTQEVKWDVPETNDDTTAPTHHDYTYDAQPTDHTGHSVVSSYYDDTATSWGGHDYEHAHADDGGDYEAYNVEPDSYPITEKAPLFNSGVGIDHDIATEKVPESVPAVVGGSDGAGSEPLPLGWEEVHDDNGTYFWNPSTGESRWERPTTDVQHEVEKEPADVNVDAGSVVEETEDSADILSSVLVAEPAVAHVETVAALADPATTKEPTEDELEEGWQPQKDENGYTYYWNTQTGESTWEAPLRKVRAKLAVLRSLGASSHASQKKELTAEEVIAEHNRRHRPTSATSTHSEDDDADDVIPCPADFEPEEWAKLPKDLQREMADGADDTPNLASSSTNDQQSESGQQGKSPGKEGDALAKDNDDTTKESSQDVDASKVESKGPGTLGSIDKDGKWQQVKPPMTQKEIAETVRKRSADYKEELVRLRVKDLRNILANLGLDTKGLRPDLSARLVAFEASTLQESLEEEAKAQAEKFRAANRERLSISISPRADSEQGLTPGSRVTPSSLFTPGSQYTPGGKHRVNSRQLLNNREHVVRSKLQAVEKVVSIDAKLASNKALTSAQRERLAAISARKQQANRSLLKTCGLVGLKPRRRVGIKGFHFDEYCVDGDSELYDVVRNPESSPQRRRMSRRRSTKRHQPGKAKQPGVSALTVTDATTTREAGNLVQKKVFFYHNPTLNQIWSVESTPMPQHVPLLIPCPQEYRVEGDRSACFVCAFALEWLHTQRLATFKQSERKYREWYDATHQRKVVGTHDRQDMRGGTDEGRIVDAAELHRRKKFAAVMDAQEATAAGPKAETRQAWSRLLTVSKPVPTDDATLQAAVDEVRLADTQDANDSSHEWAVFQVNRKAVRFTETVLATVDVLCLENGVSIREHESREAGQKQQTPNIPTRFAYNKRTLRGKWLGEDAKRLQTLGQHAQHAIDAAWEHERQRRVAWQVAADEAVLSEENRRLMFEEELNVRQQKYSDFSARNKRKLAFQRQQKQKFDRMADDLAQYGNGQFRRLQWRSAIACHPDGNTFLLHDSAKSRDIVVKEQVMLPDDADFCVESFMCLRNHCAALGTDAHVAAVLQTVVTPLLGDAATNRVRFALVTQFGSGGTLHDHMSHRIPPPQALSWIRQICAGLAAIHDCKMSHGHLNSKAICFDENGSVIVANLDICRRPQIDEQSRIREDLTNVGKLLRLMVTGRHGRSFRSDARLEDQRRVAKGQSHGGISAGVPWSNGRTIAALLQMLSPGRSKIVSAHDVVAVVDRGMVIRVSNLAIPAQKAVGAATEVMDHAYLFHPDDPRRNESDAKASTQAPTTGSGIRTRPLRPPAKPMRRSANKIDERKAYNANQERSLCASASDRALAKHAVALMTNEGKVRLAKETAVSSRLRMAFVQLLPATASGRKERLQEMDSLLRSFDLGRYRGDNVQLAVVTSFCRSLAHDTSSAQEASRAIDQAAQEAAAAAANIQSRLQHQHQDRKRGIDSKSASESTDLDSDSPRQNSGLTLPTDSCGDDANQQVNADNIETDTPTAVSNEVASDDPSAEQQSARAHADTSTTAKSENSSGENVAVIQAATKAPAPSAADQFAKDLFDALDLENTGTVAFVEGLQPWFRRMCRFVRRVQDLEEACKRAISAARQDGSLGTRDKIAALKNECDDAQQKAAEEHDVADARARLAEAISRDAKAKAVMEYRDTHPPPAPPLWSQVALLRRMNEAGIMQASNYDQSLITMSDEGGAFRLQVVSTKDVDEGKGIFNEYDYDWDLAD